MARPFQQVVEYAGKNGNILTFRYSEYQDGMVRDSFTREFQLDMNEGKVSGFKGFVFEVIEASNATITYRVIRHFP